MDTSPRQHDGWRPSPRRWRREFLLREQFVTDPAQILAESVRGERLERRQGEDTNRLIHAGMSDPGLVRWIRDVGRQPWQNRAKPDAGLAVAGRAVIDNGAADVVTALVATSGEGPGGVGARRVPASRHRRQQHLRRRHGHRGERDRQPRLHSDAWQRRRT
ncbi:hypothetical protein [Streptomyces sp. NPDC046182]|uniref:hypothetical protein n=1 Tax=Streptomyces sp. NPDC046182 TaxID=3154601 RepID=UPI003401C837